MVCETCSRAGQGPERLWQTQSATGGTPADARNIAQEVLTEAVRYYNQFGIGFHYQRSGSEQFSITGASFQQLLSALPSISFRPITADALRNTAFASYSARGDAVNYQAGRLQEDVSRGAILHELTHALQDYADFDGVHAEIEATAYMADALWLAANRATTALLVGRSLRVQLENLARRPVTTSNSRIRPAAAALCLSLGLDRTPRSLGRGDLAPLEQVLDASEGYGGYGNARFNGNGISSI